MIPMPYRYNRLCVFVECPGFVRQARRSIKPRKKVKNEKFRTRKIEGATGFSKLRKSTIFKPMWRRVIGGINNLTKASGSVDLNEKIL